MTGADSSCHKPQLNRHFTQDETAVDSQDAAVADADICTVNANVLDAATDAVLANAAVVFTADDQVYEATTLEDGTFTLDVPKDVAGTWTITTEDKTLTQDATYTEDVNTESFYLPVANIIDEIVDALVG